ncbi:MAG: hypothetical protein KatS3mg108_0576 [Isosphaeraceae bacterium]|nr:MAG: hypothetical protein KatS3mg108_0576 [Isosphaeraceae bacterium]
MYPRFEKRVGAVAWEPDDAVWVGRHSPCRLRASSLRYAAGWKTLTEALRSRRVAMIGIGLVGAWETCGLAALGGRGSCAAERWDGWAEDWRPWPGGPVRGREIPQAAHTAIRWCGEGQDVLEAVAQEEDTPWRLPSRS